MKKQGSGIGGRGSERLAAQVRAAMPPVGADAELQRDLWPEMRARLNQRGEIAVSLKTVPWFDWALAGGVAVFTVAFPAAIPVLLYYL